MDCEHFDKTNMDLLFGELDELSEAAVMRHLHHCTRCRGIWGHLRTTLELAQLPQDEPPSDLFDAILADERNAHRSLPVRERFSRTVSVLAGYAMRPQLAMAALLVLMIGSSLVFVRANPNERDRDSLKVVERGTPSNEATAPIPDGPAALVYGGEGDGRMVSDETASAAAAEQEATSPPPRTPPSATYAEAMTAYQEGRYAEAERLFAEVASNNSEQSASAAVHEGHAARNGSGCQRAAAIYDAVSERYSGNLGDEAAWHAASCYRAMGQPRRATAHYEKLLLRPAFSARAKQALIEIGPLEKASDSASAVATKPDDTNESAGDQPKASPAATQTSAAPSEKGQAPPQPETGSQKSSESEADAEKNQ